MRKLQEGSLYISALLYISFAIAAGGIRPALLSGFLRPFKMPGRPNSRGRLSLILYTGPPTKHQEKRTGVTPARKSKKKNKK